MSTFRTAAIRCIPRQEDIYGFTIFHVGRLCENILEILVWVEVVFLRRFDDAESGSACLCSRRSIGKQPVLSANDKRLDASLCTVVVDIQPAVLDVTAQMKLHSPHCFAYSNHVKRFQRSKGKRQMR